jgi:mannitol/fructose-specific phosphotransferase system IIA component (Ntr-type)
MLNENFRKNLEKAASAEEVYKLLGNRESQ